MSKKRMTPSVAHIKLSPENVPYLEGVRCSACEIVYTEHRRACPKCGTRTGQNAVLLKGNGKIHTYSIVHRSYPGVETPFISAVVALENGGSLQATIKGIPAEVNDSLFGLPVSIVFGQSGQRDKNDVAYLSYHFEPTENLQPNSEAVIP